MPRRKSLESGATTELALSGTDGSTHPPSSGESGANVEIRARLYGSINAELKVRIRFPPAVSRANQWFPSSGARILETRETTEGSAELKF
jgi:hypothetical protein